MRKKIPIAISACILFIGVIMIVSTVTGGKKPFKDLEDPPCLTVISDEIAHDALLGTYSWRKRNSDGTSTETNADSPHPLDCEELLLKKFETGETTVTLNFAENPDSILDIRCWNEEHWNNPNASSEKVAINKYEIELKQGGYIYEVVAEWNTEKSGYGGIAHYYFYIQVGNNETTTT